MSFATITASMTGSKLEKVGVRQQDNTFEFDVNSLLPPNIRMGLTNIDSRQGELILEGGSLGLQAGVQSSDLILVFRTRRGVESLNRGKFTLGADAAVAAGPVGRFAQAATDTSLKAEIYAYSRARGLFAGIALDGAVLGVDNDANAAVFGDKVTPRMIFDGDIRRVPSRLVDFRDRLEEASAE